MTLRQIALAFKGREMIFYVDEPDHIRDVDDSLPGTILKNAVELYILHEPWFTRNDLVVYSAGFLDGLDGFIPFYPSQDVFDGQMTDINIIDGEELTEDIRRQ